MPKGYYLEIAELANALTEVALNSERGPHIILLKEGELVVLDFDGNQVTTIKGHENA